MNNQQNSPLLIDASGFTPTTAVKGFFVITLNEGEEINRTWVSAETKVNFDFQEGTSYRFFSLYIISIYLPDGKVVEEIKINHRTITNKTIFLVLGWVSLFATTARVYVTYPEKLEETIKHYQPSKPTET